eukprot:TRINITY_DN57300_c0_g1_i1.p1 TRINITY_DN57300_c0_g1~~TRINITY_DN57300_c0_g1_i1.p1  ORF type:complete len:344 (+),score=79.87 TRINITY_DN57300_c0_g1_i1:111-1034(+)
MGTPPALPPTWEAFWASALAWALLFLALWAAALGGLKLVGFEPPDGAPPRRTWALKASMLVHHAVVGPLALAAIVVDPVLREAFLCFGCEDAAWNLVRDASVGPSALAALLVPITTGYMVADLLLLHCWSLSKASRVENVLMVLHHTISLGVWPPTLFYDYCSRYVVVLISYEVSSVFLTLNWFLSTAGRKSGSMYKVSGLLFTLSFVLIRMVGALPQLRALWYAPPWTSTVYRAVAPGELMEWQVLLTSTLVLPHLLNLFWGVKVIRGFLAVLRKQKAPGSRSAPGDAAVDAAIADGSPAARPLLR